ncbi:MAG: hypothetical protein QG608_1960 [Actinomycetota bacterium]|nr:hypothetical protein [Actinomycetota bacterium]
MPIVSSPHVPARLGVGPMSVNCVDAVIETASRNRTRIMLIPSRRQIESGPLRGYVGGWDTADLVDYVRRRDPEKRVLICRDHGGPWQHPSEISMDETAAMSSCLRSFIQDLDSSFDLLHIDTSVEGSVSAEAGTALDRLISLYGQTHAYATAHGHEVLFEIGFEDQSADTNDPSVFQSQLAEVFLRLRSAGLPLPTFVVAQTATKVRETRNCGAILLAPSAVGHAIRDLAGICTSLGSALKSHNADYLPASSLQTLERNGVSAVNVAPELGVAETRALITLMTTAGLKHQRDDFLALALESGAWAKWMGPDTSAGDEHRAVVAGHYVFGSEEFTEIKKQVEYAYRHDAVTVDGYLRRAVTAVIERYLRYFVAPAHLT